MIYHNENVFLETLQTFLLFSYSDGGGYGGGGGDGGGGGSDKGGGGGKGERDDGADYVVV